MKESAKLQSDLGNLESAISVLDVPMLDSNKMTLLKSRVMGQVSLNVPQLDPDIAFTMRVKERVFVYIEAHAQKKFFVANFVSFHKRIIASALVLMMAFTMFNYVNIDTQVVYADTFTILDNVDGEVDVLRSGEAVRVYVGMELFEKDTIVTGEDSGATIRFFDDTVSRLAAQTELRLKRLSRATYSAQSYVEVALDGGEIWSHVVGFNEDNSSFVVGTDDLQLETGKGAFDVKLSGGDVEVGVYSHSLEVKSGEDVDEIMSGEMLVLEFDSESFTVENFDDGVVPIAWVQENLDSDEIYLLEVEERLLSAKVASVGVEVGEDFSSDNSLREDALLFLTFDDVKKQRIELDIAERTFVEAQIKLEDPEITDAEKAEADAAITSFSLEVEEFLELVDEVETTDEEYADELGEYVENKIVSQRKGLSLTTPEDNSYEALEAVEDLAIIITEEEVVDVVDQDETLDPMEETEVDEVLLVPIDPKQIESEVEVVEVVVPAADSLVDEHFNLEEEYGVQVQGDKALDPLLY